MYVRDETTEESDMTHTTAPTHLVEEALEAESCVMAGGLELSFLSALVAVLWLCAALEEVLRGVGAVVWLRLLVVFALEFADACVLSGGAAVEDGGGYCETRWFLET